MPRHATKYSIGCGFVFYDADESPDEDELVANLYTIVREYINISNLFLFIKYYGTILTIPLIISSLYQVVSNNTYSEVIR